MSDVTYAVHTRTCTYLLDDEGVCRWIISPTGMVPGDVGQCMNAQFVACIDASAPGALVGELRIGANALFVRAGADGRLALLRTGIIDHVEFRGGDGDAPVRPPPRPLAPPAEPRGPSKRRTTDKSNPAIELDATDLIVDEEVTVTLTMPLFRDGVAGPPPPKRPSRRRT